MKNLYFLLILNVTVLLGMGLVAVQSQEAQRPGQSSSLGQKEMSVTVYNNGLGLVKDVRQVELLQGTSKLEFTDVASSIQPATVSVKSLDKAALFKVLEQNYEYDLMSQEKVLDKYEGKDVKLVNWNDYHDRQDSVDATVLSASAQIFKVKEDIYLGYPGYKVVPEIPENLIAKPTLVWLYDSVEAGPSTLEVTYLTSNISWKADYVVIVSPDEKTGALSGWVTLDNQSGAQYQNADLTLVAGDVNRVQEMGMQAPKAMMMARGVMADSSAFEEKAFFEYHRYDLNRKTTIKDKQTKQIGLLASAGLGLEKELIVEGQQGYLYQKYWEPLKHSVNVYIKFKNTQANGLGVPLPAGIMRLYKEDEKGRQLFIGEDRIDHTPIEEDVRLKMGESFDVVAERVQTDYQEVSSKIRESEWEITLKNRKNEDIVVRVMEPMTGDWKIISKTHEFTKPNAFTARFDVSIPKNSEVKLKYRVSIEFK